MFRDWMVWYTVGFMIRSRSGFGVFSSHVLQIIVSIVQYFQSEILLYLPVLIEVLRGLGKQENPESIRGSQTPPPLWQ